MTTETKNKVVERTPSVDIWETAAEATIVANVPGVSQEALKVHVTDGVLSIEGRTERGPASEEAAKTEIVYARRFVLDDTIDVAAITAKVSNGVLTLVLPRREELKPRTIDVQVA